LAAGTSKQDNAPAIPDQAAGRAQCVRVARGVNDNVKTFSDTLAFQLLNGKESISTPIGGRLGGFRP
jgi:hypothetical protein